MSKDRAMEHNLQWARVIRVYDGDTIFVETGNIGMKVRIANVNTPERGQPNYVEARDFTRKELEGKWVGLQNHVQQWDLYGRRIASVWYGKDYEKNIADELLARGLGVSDPTKMPSPMRVAHPKGLLPPDVRARSYRRGV